MTAMQTPWSITRDARAERARRRWMPCRAKVLRSFQAEGKLEELLVVPFFAEGALVGYAALAWAALSRR